MKKFLSIFLAVVMVFSCLGVLASASGTQYYRDGVFEFYLENGGAHIVNIRQASTPTTVVQIPLSLCYDAEKKIDAPTGASIWNDDNDAPDPFGSDYAYVTAIESSALHNYENSITSISIPRYVQELDLDVLRDADTLQEIEVADNSQYFASHNGTLYSADKKQLLVHPRGSSDNSILSSVTSFEKKAFQNCELITSLTLPAGITAIPERCFDGCTALKSIDMSAARIGKIGTYAFLNTGLESVNLGETIKMVEAFAFYNNSNLTELVIPKEAKNVVLKAGAFIGCPIENLTVYRSITEIGDKALGYYYDADFTLQKYDDLVITSYKCNEDKTATTPLYQYVKANEIKFIPLDDIYSITVSCDQIDGYSGNLFLYVGTDKAYSVTSENGVFSVENVPRATYDVYMTSEFGVMIKVGTIDIQTGDFLEDYSKDVTDYEPIGDVNRDGDIDIADISTLLLDGVYAGSDARYDIDKDGVVSFSDISVILATVNYGSSGVVLPDEEFTSPIIPL